MDITTAAISQPLRMPSTVSALAFCAAAAVLGLFGMYLATGIGQDSLQVVSSSADYATILMQNPQAMKLVLGLDNLFILLYAPMFLAMGAALYHQAGARVMLVSAISLLALTGLLDLAENMHFRAMLGSAELGIAIDQGQIGLQIWESLVKFHVSYIGLFLLSFVLPRETPVERLLCFLLRWVQGPFGILIYVVPGEMASPLLIARFAFFFVSLAMIGVIFRRISGSNAPV